MIAVMRSMSVLITFLLFGLTGYSQSRLTGFWGLSFGESPGSVKTSVKKSHGIDTPPEEKGSTLTYTNVKFAGREADGAVLGFYENKLYVGVFIIKPESPTGIIELYESMVKDISKKYHLPNTVEDSYKYPYNSNSSDGEKLLAVRYGYAELASEWEFINDKGYKDRILVEVDKDCYLTVKYTYGPIFQVLIDLQKQSNNSDL